MTAKKPLPQAFQLNAEGADKPAETKPAPATEPATKVKTKAKAAKRRTKNKANTKKDSFMTPVYDVDLLIEFHHPTFVDGCAVGRERWDRNDAVHAFSGKSIIQTHDLPIYFIAPFAETRQEAGEHPALTIRVLKRSESDIALVLWPKQEDEDGDEVGMELPEIVGVIRKGEEKTFAAWQVSSPVPCKLMVMQAAFNVDDLEFDDEDD